MENNQRFAVDPRAFYGPQETKEPEKESSGFGSIFSKHKFLFISIGIIIAFILILVIGNFVIRPMFADTPKAPDVLEGLKFIPGMGYITHEYYQQLASRAEQSQPSPPTGNSEAPASQAPVEKYDEESPIVEYEDSISEDVYAGDSIIPEDVDEISEYILGIDDDDM